MSRYLGLSGAAFLVLAPFQVLLATPVAPLQLPLHFEAVASKSDAAQSYIANDPNFSLTVSPREMRISLIDPVTRTRRGFAARFLGARAAVRVRPEEPYTATANYFIGESSKWRSGVPLYQRIRFNGLYSGIDLIVYGAGTNLEYDFLVAPSADPRQIRMSIRGASQVKIESGGDLSILIAGQAIRLKKPAVFQEVAGRRISIAGKFVLRGDSEVGFEIAGHDRSLALLIDPVLSYSSYFGGKSNEAARGLAVDSSGNVYITGFTTSADLPITAGAFQPAYAGGTANLLTGDVFVAKYNSTGVLQYVTYIGGDQDDVGSAITADSVGNAYVTGVTNSQNFPVTPGAAQPKFGGFGGNDLIRLGDAFVVKLNRTGTLLLYSTFLGGRRDDSAGGIAVDPNGNAYVTGTTLSTDFPTTAGAYQTTNHGIGGDPIPGGLGVPFLVGGDAFLTKINATGSQFIYSTLLGGSRGEQGVAVALDAQANAYVGGFTISSDFPTTAQAFQRKYAGVDNLNFVYHMGDGFVAKFGPAGDLVYSTLLGGSGDDMITAIAVDSAGSAYVTGSTESIDFPVMNPLQKTMAGPYVPTAGIDQVYGDAFVTKLNPAGSALVYSTFLGGPMDEIGTSISVDGAGNAYVGGMTLSPTFPVTADAAQSTFAGLDLQFPAQEMGDGFISVINSAGTAISYSTFLGGSLDDAVGAMAIDASGNLWVTGTTLSTDFPIRGAAAQSTFGGATRSPFFHGDAFLSKLSGFASLGSGPVVNAVVNGASFAAGGIVPGEIATGFGTNLTSSTGINLTSTLPLPTEFLKVSLLVNDSAVPLFAVDNVNGQQQINFQVPWDVAGKSTATIAVSNNGTAGAAITVPVLNAQPGIFAYSAGGKTFGAILHANFQLADTAHPAKAGETVLIYCTGLGSVNNPPQSGAAGSGQLTVATPAVTIGGAKATVSFSGLAPGFVGLYQINAMVPLGLASGNQPVAITMVNASSNSVLLPVQ